MDDAFIELIDKWRASYNRSMWNQPEGELLEMVLRDIDDDMSISGKLDDNASWRSPYGAFVRLNLHESPLREQVEFFIGLLKS